MITTNIQKKAPAKHIKPNVSVNKQFLQILSIKDLDTIAGGPGDPMCPYCFNKCGEQDE